MELVLVLFHEHEDQYNEELIALDHQFFDDILDRQIPWQKKLQLKKRSKFSFTSSSKKGDDDESFDPVYDN